MYRPANTETHGADVPRQLDTSSESDGNTDESEASEGDSVGIEILQREYVSKDGIIDAVAQYHVQILCPFKVSKSGKR